MASIKTAAQTDAVPPVLRGGGKKDKKQQL